MELKYGIAKRLEELEIGYSEDHLVDGMVIALADIETKENLDNRLKVKRAGFKYNGKGKWFLAMDKKTFLEFKLFRIKQMEIKNGNKD